MKSNIITGSGGKLPLPYCTSMKIILITDQLSGQKWAYRSITAAVSHFENPLDLTQRRWNQLLKAAGGEYPISHSGCTIEKLEALGMKEVIGDNPPMVEPKKRKA